MENDQDQIQTDNDLQDQNTEIQDGLTDEERLDPMLAGLLAAEESKDDTEEGDGDDQGENEDSAKGDTAQPETEKTQDQEAQVEKQQGIMIPKPRFDEVLAQKSALENRTKELEARLEALSEKDKAEEGQQNQSASTSYQDKIAERTKQILKLADAYEEGEINFREATEKTEALRNEIREIERQEYEGLLNQATSVAQKTVIANKVEDRVAEYGDSIMDQFPQVSLIEQLPEDKRQLAWDVISAAAVVNLRAKGIDPYATDYHSRVALVNERAELTNVIGPVYTGVQTAPADKKDKGLSEQGAQRKAKIEVANQQPPTIPRGAGEHKETGLSLERASQMTQDDLANFSEDELKRLLK